MVPLIPGIWFYKAVYTRPISPIIGRFGAESKVPHKWDAVDEFVGVFTKRDLHVLRNHPRVEAIEAEGFLSVEAGVFRTHHHNSGRATKELRFSWDLAIHPLFPVSNLLPCEEPLNLHYSSAPNELQPERGLTYLPTFNVPGG